MSPPHPALLDLVAGRPLGTITDEAALLASAGEHRMVGALIAAVGAGRARLGVESTTTLGVWDLAERRSHLHLWKVLDEVQRRLEPIGVEVAVLKGIATEARWYDALGERVATDLDVLMDPAALPEVADVIRRLEDGTGPIDTAAELVARGQLQHVDLVVDGVQVDLHFDPLKLGMATRCLQQVWSGTEVLATPQGDIRVLAPEVELVLLLLHQNKDGFAYLGPMLDVKRLVQRAELDWGTLRSFVTNQGLEVPVWSSLGAVAEVVGLDLELSPVSGPRAAVWRRLWHRRLGGHEARETAPGRQRALPLVVRGRGPESIRALRRELVPQRELLEVAGRLDPDDSYVRHLVRAAGRRSG